MIFRLYRTATCLMAPVISHYLKKRLAKGKEHPQRFPERLGQAALDRPAGKLVWLHGASVGEAQSLLSLIDGIQDTYPDYSILMTTGSVTSAALMEKRLPKGVIHQFVPVDRVPYVRKFLDHWKPDFAIWSESELWPNLIVETKERAIPMVLVNARMSDKSLKTWQRMPKLAKRLIGAFDLCLAQTQKDGERYQSLGAKRVESAGNLKFASDDLPYDEDEFAAFTEMSKGREAWLAASTHKGEESIIAQCHGLIKQNHPEVLSIIVPRHPERGASIAQEIENLGFNCARRSLGEKITPETDIYVADTLGELGLFYRYVPLVFVGKSLSEKGGGQNPLEPARLDCALLCGPSMDNFAEIMDTLKNSGAVQEVSGATDLFHEVNKYLYDRDLCQQKAALAKDVANAQAEVLDKTMLALAPFFKGG